MDPENEKPDDVKYRASLQSCKNWNSQLAQNRRTRIPYFDAQTNVDQIDVAQRTAGLRELPDNLSETYIRYPQRRWRRRKDPNVSRPLAENPEHEVTCLPDWKLFQDSTELEEALVQDEDSDEDFKYKGRKSAGGRKLPNRRSSTRSNRLSNDNQRSRLKPSIDDDYEAYEPQHECHICGHRVLHQSSLGYHMRKAHPELLACQNSAAIEHKRPVFNNVLNYGKCDVCSNGPDTSSEDMALLVKCSGPCKRLTHPYCVNLPANIVKMVSTYAWECQDCKHCSKCGLDENDDKLLFCDDCDRGVHLYCLNPPLKNAPSGRWTCGICA